MARLSQRRGILTIDSEIVADGVIYRERNLLHANEIKIPFESISDDVTRSFSVSRLYLFICLFFAVALVVRVNRFLTTSAVSLPSLLWSMVLFAVPALGTWMQSPKYVGVMTDRGALLFFDTKGTQDPTGYLEDIQTAKHAYFRARYGGHPAAPRSAEPESQPIVH